jgi:hypothetical protein
MWDYEPEYAWDDFMLRVEGGELFAFVPVRGSGTSALRGRALIRRGMRTYKVAGVCDWSRGMIERVFGFGRMRWLFVVPIKLLEPVILGSCGVVSARMVRITPPLGDNV